MVYLRAKKNGTENYLYLVKSVWNKKENTSKQEIIKYLGKATTVVKEDIPDPYKDDPKIISALSSYNPKNSKIRDNLIEKTRRFLYQSMLKGDIKSSDVIYRRYSKVANTSDFFNRILRPVMYKIGGDWETGKVSIAEEHVASNVAQKLVRGITHNTFNSSKQSILICVPTGEEHHLGCDMLEVFLSTKGFKVFNIRRPIPTESILGFINDNQPNCILVSVTLEENLTPCKRLIKKIRNKYDKPIFVGGYAFQANDISNFDAEIIREMELETILKKIKKTIK